MGIKSEFEIYRGTVEATTTDIILRPTEFQGWRHLLCLLPPRPMLAAEVIGLVFYLRERFQYKLSAPDRRNLNYVIKHLNYAPSGEPYD